MKKYCKNCMWSGYTDYDTITCNHRTNTIRKKSKVTGCITKSHRNDVLVLNPSGKCNKYLDYRLVLIISISFVCILGLAIKSYVG